MCGLAFLATTLLLLRMQQLVAAQETTVLIQLVQNGCLQKCYIPACPDIDPACVCGVVDSKVDSTMVCAQNACPLPGGGLEPAWKKLEDECTLRKEVFKSSAPATLSVSTDGPLDTPAGTSVMNPLRTKLTYSAGPITFTTSTASEITAPVTTVTLVVTGIAHPNPSIPASDPESTLQDKTATQSPNNTHTSTNSNSTNSNSPFPKPKNSSSPIVIAAIAAPLSIFFILGLGLFLWVRRRNKLRRASITTFMDESDANQPIIGAPLDVRHEKLPPVLNGILQTPPSQRKTLPPIDPFMTAPPTVQRTSSLYSDQLEKEEAVAPVRQGLPSNPRELSARPSVRKPSVRRPQGTLSAISEVSGMRVIAGGTVAEYDVDWDSVQQELRDIQLVPKRI